MKPVRTEKSNQVYRGNGRNVGDLHCEVVADDVGQREVASVWEPSEGERKLIADGANVKIRVFDRRPVAPVSLEVTTEEVFG